MERPYKRSRRDALTFLQPEEPGKKAESEPDVHKEAVALGLPGVWYDEVDDVTATITEDARTLIWWPSQKQSRIILEEGNIMNVGLQHKGIFTAEEIQWTDDEVWTRGNASKPGKSPKGIKLDALELQRIGVAHWKMHEVILCWAVYRESARRHKEEPATYYTQRSFFDEVLECFDRDVARKIWQISVAEFSTVKRKAKRNGFKDAFERCHFTNTFHENDNHNEIILSLKQTCEKELIVIVVVLAYFTQNRSFVEWLVRFVSDPSATVEHWCESPEDFFRQAIHGYYSKFASWKQTTYPCLFARRFRPMLLQDNRVRAAYAKYYADGMTPEDARTNLISAGYAFVSKHAAQLAKNATVVVNAANTYGSLFQQLQGFLNETREKNFHAKNLANTLELCLCPGAKDSKRNGLGPGYRGMAQVVKALGVGGSSKLSQKELTEELDAATEFARSKWPQHPDLRVPYRRHVQSWYCEVLRLLQFFRNGTSFSTCARKHRGITLQSTLRIAARKQKQKRKRKDALSLQRPLATDGETGASQETPVPQKHEYVPGVLARRRRSGSGAPVQRRGEQRPCRRAAATTRARPFVSTTRAIVGPPAGGSAPIEVPGVGCVGAATSERVSWDQDIFDLPTLDEQAEIVRRQHLASTEALQALQTCSAQPSAGSAPAAPIAAGSRAAALAPACVSFGAVQGDS